MQLVILSAGIGRRLKPLTERMPKCMVNVSNQPILKHQIDLFIKNDIIKDIIIVIGYKADMVKNFIKNTYKDNKKIKLVENKDYLDTNNMYSLFLTKDFLNNSFLLINGDVIIEQKIVEEFLQFPFGDAIAVDIGHYYEESMKVIQEDGLLIDISKKITQDNAYGCSIDFYKFSEKGKEIFFSRMEDIICRRKEITLWTEVALKELLNEGILPMKAFDIKGKNWIEIDDFEDLKKAEKLF